MDYSKYEQSKNTNFRNGYSTKNVRTSLGESKIKVPRDRDSSFNPMLVPKPKNIFLRWICGKDLKGVDPGIQPSIKPSVPSCPLENNPNSAYKRIALQFC
ncbi:transposase [Ichthyobacterium seriolicida]|uniref:Transposase n=1 Tax=Ichthyobacterium seriolicida TaxID=242600 RepID=A0A1J1E9L4_9FLAO|nr:transposase [Ichthyobacterium seriolicida]